jgi:hypothetical protein
VVPGVAPLPSIPAVTPVPGTPAASPPVPILPSVALAFPPAKVTMPSRIRGASSPPAMIPDRIPPRVDTPVAVSVSGAVSAANPVILSIEGAGPANGTATIADSVIASPVDNHIINLQGDVQTVPGNAGNLRLVATQAGARLAVSNGFSISAIPQNLSFNGSSEIKNDQPSTTIPGAQERKRGFVVDYIWESDSNNLTDLGLTDQCERVEVASATGVFAGTVPNTKGCSPSTSISDIHDVTVAVFKDGKLIAKLDGVGKLITKQTFVFQDKRSAATKVPTNVPMTHSGFIMTRFVFPSALGPAITIISTKTGAATTAKGVSSEAGGGSTFVPQFF